MVKYFHLILWQLCIISCEYYCMFTYKQFCLITPFADFGKCQNLFAKLLVSLQHFALKLFIYPSLKCHNYLLSIVYDWKCESKNKISYLYLHTDKFLF